MTLLRKVYASLEAIKTYHAKGSICSLSRICRNVPALLVLALARGDFSQCHNANHVAREAQIIAESGQMGAVTVATSMAGRGTRCQTRSRCCRLGWFDCDWYRADGEPTGDLQIQSRPWPAG